MFPQSVIEKIGYYVYFLRDPNTKEVFYIGKGKANRLFDHVACAVAEETDSDKLNKIRAIQQSGKSVEHLVLRHGLTEDAAFEVEAAVIDFVRTTGLSNVQGGHHSSEVGLKCTDEIIGTYSATPFATDEPVLLININKLYNPEMTAPEVYEATRKSWVLGPRRKKVKYVVATYRGLTREVYEIEEWYPIGKRWAFRGHIAGENIRAHLRYKSITEFTKRGSANPVRYINC